MRFYDVLPSIGDELVDYLAREERLRLGMAARFLHPAISWARYAEGRCRFTNYRLRWTPHRIASKRVRMLYQRLLIFSEYDSRGHEIESTEIEHEAIIEAIRTEERLRKAYLNQLRKQFGAKRRRCA